MLSCPVNLKSIKSKSHVFVLSLQAYRGFKVRQKYGPLLNSKTGKIDLETSKFIRPYAKRWKARSIFQILLLYRSARYQDLVNLTQQVCLRIIHRQFDFSMCLMKCYFLKIHLYNQAAVSTIRKYNECMMLEKIDPRETNPALLGAPKLPVRKLPFRLDEIPFYDTNYMCDPLTGGPLDVEDSDQEEWDAPLRRTPNVSSHISQSNMSSAYNSNKYQR